MTKILKTCASVNIELLRYQLASTWVLTRLKSILERMMYKKVIGNYENQIVLEGNTLGILTWFIHFMTHTCHLLLQNACLFGSQLSKLHVLNTWKEDNICIDFIESEGSRFGEEGNLEIL